jgi:L-asparaginase/Glu-tRNA(Gln) amidotransferase subunit D
MEGALYAVIGYQQQVRILKGKTLQKAHSNRRFTFQNDHVTSYVVKAKKSESNFNLS